MHDLQHEMGKNIASQEFPKMSRKLKCLESVVDHGYIFEDINNILTKNIIRGLFWKLEHIPFYIVQWT